MSTIVEMETEKGTIRLELWPSAAINTVKNFVELASNGFYDALKFHRVIPEFVVQGGDPLGNGTGGPGYAIPCETSGSRQKHVKGAISMAHAGKDTGGSQFFLVLNENNCKHLDGKHTVFGVVKDGLKVVENVKQGDKILKIQVVEVDQIVDSHDLQRVGNS